MLKKLLLTLLAVSVLTISLTTLASAKDDKLEHDLIVLEKSYIPPLFFTSAMAMTPSVNSMRDLKINWARFKAEYFTYKPDFANWQTYFYDIDAAIAEADAIITNAAKLKNPALLPPAHDSLEKVRMVMLDLRGRNGFPKFITDKMTKYHEPMETIVLSVKGLAPAQITPELKEQLKLNLQHAWKTWSDVEKCPVDQTAWMLTDMQMTQYSSYLTMARSALESFSRAMDADDAAGIIKYGVGIKAPFVEAYKTFGNFAMYLPPPAI